MREWLHDLCLIIAAVMVQDAVDQIPESMRRLVCRMAARLPGEDAEIMRETWLGELEVIPSKFAKLWFVLPLLVNYAKTQQAIVERETHIAEAHTAAQIALEEIAFLQVQLHEERWRLQMHDKYIDMHTGWKEDAVQCVAQFQSATDPDGRDTWKNAMQRVQDYAESVKKLNTRKLASKQKISLIRGALRSMQASEAWHGSDNLG